MQTEIKDITSPHHKQCLLIKRTACKATVQLKEDSVMGDSPFLLLVRLADPYAPRMAVEVDDKSHQAAMVQTPFNIQSYLFINLICSRSRFILNSTSQNNLRMNMYC